MRVASERLSYGSSASQYVRLHYPPHESPRPLVVFLHGGFWKSRYGLDPPTAACETLPPDLTACGFVLAEVEYRRSNDAQWGWPHTNEDVLRAFETVLAHVSSHVDTSNIILLGHSAGATLALWLAAQLVRTQTAHLPNFVFALAPVADLRMAVRLRLSDEGDAVQRYMHGSPEQVPTHYEQACPTALATELAAVNVRLVAAANDDDVPLSVVDSLCEAIRDAPVFESRKRASLVVDVFSSATHYDLVNATSPTWAHIRETMLKLCTTTPTDPPP